MMTAKERMLWEQAVRVLQQNTVTPTVAAETPRVRRLLFLSAHERSASQRKP